MSRMKEFEQELESIWKDICGLMSKDTLSPDDVKRYVKHLSVQGYVIDGYYGGD